MGRSLYLSLDRADVQFAVKELSRHLQNPTEQSWGKLKLLGRYLKGYPESSLRFELTSSPEILNRWVDADWGGQGADKRFVDMVPDTEHRLVEQCRVGILCDHVRGGGGDGNS